MKTKLSGSLRNLLACLLACGVIPSQVAHADDFPSRPIRIIVPFAAGGASDKIARSLAVPLAETLKTSVFVENKPGGGSIIAMDFAAKAPADGYTIIYTQTSVIQQPALKMKLPYDIFKDFVPLGQINEAPNVLVVSKQSNIKSVEELVQRAKADPKNFAFGSYGSGTSSHIQGESFNLQSGLSLSHVPYKGAGPLLLDLLGGQVNVGWVDVMTLQPYIKTGDLTPLAVTGTEPHRTLPGVHTMQSLGYKYMDVVGWQGLAVRSGTPQPIVDKLQAAVKTSLASKKMQDLLIQLGATPATISAQEFSEKLRRDAATWKKLIDESKIEME